MKTVRVHIDKDGWPESIPWPVKGEWTTHTMHDGSGRCCLNGWMHVAFTGQPRGSHQSPRAARAVARMKNDPARSAAARQFQQALRDAVRRRGFNHDGWVNEIAMFNNDPKTTDADRTAVWAEAAAACGYDAP